MRRMLLGATAVAATLAAAAPAHAATEWTPARLVSTAGAEQARGISRDPVISRDGRYVAYLTNARNLIPADVPPEERPTSTFALRHDLETGHVELIAGVAVEHLSISADGRYVAFDTRDALLPGLDANGVNDVYVRDMEGDRGDEASYRLASAPDGEQRALATVGLGSLAPPGTALSADGTRVLFAVTSASDLAGAGTPAGQLAVRDLEGGRTTLITTRYDPGTGAWTDEPASNVGVAAERAGNPGAAISDDGRVVGFVARQNGPPELVPMLEGEPLGGKPNELDLYVRSPVGTATAGPIRRALGIADPDDPACDGTYPASGRPDRPPYTAPTACETPLIERIAGEFTTEMRFALTGDGRTAAFSASAYMFRAAQQPQEGSPTANGLADVRAGVTRKAGLTELARSGDPEGGLANPERLVLSADGRWLLMVGYAGHVAPPGPVSADADPGGLGCSTTRPCIHAIDLERNVSRVAALSYDGVAPGLMQGPDPSWGYGDARISRAAISGDGSRIAFSTNANAMFYGDVNESEDVFVVDRVERTPPPGQQVLPPSVLPFTTGPDWVMRVRTGSLRDGRLRVYASVPGPGRVTAKATARVKRRKRPVASGARRAAGPQLVKLTLRPRKALRGRVRRKGGLETKLVVRFTPQAGQRALTERREARFLVKRRKR